MTPEERREALKANSDVAWDGLKKELMGEKNKEEDKEPTSNDESDIPIIKLSASGSFDEDYSSGEFKNIVTTTVTLSFYNVGSQVSGYGGVSMSSKAVSSLNGSSFESKCSGVFSGGPNGSFRLSGDCDGTTLRLQNGSTINHGPLQLSVSNPSAFSYWEK